MIENFPNLLKNINLKIQAIQKTLRLNPPKIIVRDIILIAKNQTIENLQKHSNEGMNIRNYMNKYKMLYLFSEFL